MFPLVTDFQEPFRVIRDYTVRLMLDAPAHEVVFIDGPVKHWTSRGSNIAGKAGTARAEHSFLKHVEGDIRELEELSGVGGRETDVGDGVGREVVSGQREEFHLSFVRAYDERVEMVVLPPSTRERSFYARDCLDVAVYFRLSRL